MATVIWSDIATDDLRDIYNYIAQNSIQYAENTFARITNRTRALASHPRMGRMVPEFEKDMVRELIEGDYRVIYRLESEELISISRIWHSSRPLTNL